MRGDLNSSGVRPINGIDKWCVHSYYTLCPYAPDGSGRLLLAAADLEGNMGEVYILSKDGAVLDKFGKNRCESNFFHTGLWQTWSPDAKHVYYQGGSMENPKIVRRELETGATSTIDGDMEGAPPSGEPIVSGLLGMLYAAGYGDGNYYPDQAPVPFAKRDAHGLFEYSLDPRASRLALSVGDVLAGHPERDRLLREDRLMKSRLGENDGLTLMCYCVRWAPTGERCLFYFGNHCVDKKRGEPRLSYVFTADKSLKDIRPALDLSFGRRGVHWSWHPDGVHLVGYGPDPENDRKTCLAQVAWDGSGYKKISSHASGGHPSISPVDYNLLVTDEGGRVVFIDLTRDKEVDSFALPNAYGDKIPPGRNPFRVCHHPVFDRDGRTVLVNTLPGKNARLCEIEVKGR